MRAGERLFAIDMFPELHCRHRDRRVHVVWRSDDDRIDLLVHLVEKLAPVLKDLRAGVCLVQLLRASQVDFSDGDEARVRRLQHFGEVAPGTAGSPEVGETEIPAGSTRGGGLPADPGSGEGGGGGGFEEVAAGGHRGSFRFEV